MDDDDRIAVIRSLAPEDIAKLSPSDRDAVYRQIFESGSKPGPNGLLVIFQALVIVASVFAALVTAAIHINWRWLWEALRSGGPAAHVVLTLALFGVGFGLFEFRERAPRAYGWTEIGVGAAAIYSAFALPSASDFERALKVVGGIYLMVRGHDNRVNGPARMSAARLTRQFKRDRR